MSRYLSLAAMPLLALSLVSACTSPETDELLADSTDEVALDGKADSPSGAYTYYAIRGDMRRCAWPMCGEFWLSRVNRASTVCHDNSTASECYTPVLDWSHANLDQGQQDKLKGQAWKPGGTFALVRGRFAKKNTTTPRPELGRFIVTEAWVAEGENPPEGVFAKVFQNGIRCIAEPCPSLTEKGLNTSNSANIAELDYSPSGLTDRQIDGFVSQYVAPQGIIVAGDRYTFKISGRPGKGRTVTNGFHKLENPPASACHVGGCSGEICSDQEGVSSICIFRPEFACYQDSDARCERQPSGDCGWTPTPELNSCLGNVATQN
ncbi:MAG: hypothetical protein H0T46_24100 [Deltaproteobacteria bacterium]|nr:hypothetical protein [Deltaproteobacteria bacterium]